MLMSGCDQRTCTCCSLMGIQTHRVSTLLLWLTAEAGGVEWLTDMNEKKRASFCDCETLYLEKQFSSVCPSVNQLRAVSNRLESLVWTVSLCVQTRGGSRVVPPAEPTGGCWSSEGFEVLVGMVTARLIAPPSQIISYHIQMETRSRGRETTTWSVSSVNPPLLPLSPSLSVCLSLSVSQCLSVSLSVSQCLSVSQSWQQQQQQLCWVCSVSVDPAV